MVTLADDPTASEFEGLLARHSAVVMDFYATWCAPCKQYSPRFAQAAREARRKWPEASIAFCKVDIDRAPELKRRFGVQSVPTTLVLERKRSLLGGERMRPTTRLSGNIAQHELVALIERLVTRWA